MASWEIQDGVQDGRQKKILFFSKYMSSTQYQLWYNQIFAGFLMNVDYFLGKTEISMGNTQIIQILVIFCSHMVIFKGTRWIQNFRESNLFFLQENVRHGLLYLKMPT